MDKERELKPIIDKILSLLEAEKVTAGEFETMKNIIERNYKTFGVLKTELKGKESILKLIEENEEKRKQLFEENNKLKKSICM